jgi:hypothetical protein
LVTSNGTKTAFFWQSDYLAYSQVYSGWYKDEIAQDSFSDFPANGFKVDGDIILGKVSSAATVYNVVYLDNTGTWNDVNQTTSASTKMLGILLNYRTGTGYVLLEGHIQVEASSFGNAPYVQNVDHGLPIYIRSGAVAGMSTNVPTADYVRILGHAYYNNTSDTTTWIMRFDPDNTWIKI